MLNKEYDVIIIGAGMAGIVAAKYLINANKSVLVLEAQNRIGGRAYTDISNFDIPLDLGCSWLHSSDINPLTELIKEKGITIIPDNGEHDEYYFQNRQYSTSEGCVANFDKV